MKIVITGAAGLFGHGLAQIFSTRHEVFALTHSDLDFTKGDVVCAVLKKSCRK